MHKSVHSNTVCNNSKLEIQMFISNGKENKFVLHCHNGNLLSNENDKSTTIHSMDESHKHRRIHNYEFMYKHKNRQNYSMLLELRIMDIVVGRDSGEFWNPDNGLSKPGCW